MKTLLLILLSTIAAHATTGRFYMLPSGAWNFATDIAPDRIDRLHIYCPDGATFFTNKDTADKVFDDVIDSFYRTGAPLLRDTTLNIDSTGKPIF